MSSFYQIEIKVHGRCIEGDNGSIGAAVAVLAAPDGQVLRRKKEYWPESSCPGWQTAELTAMILGLEGALNETSLHSISEQRLHVMIFSDSVFTLNCLGLFVGNNSDFGAHRRGAMSVDNHSLVRYMEFLETQLRMKAVLTYHKVSWEENEEALLYWKEEINTKGSTIP